MKGVGVLEEGEGCTRVKGGHGQGESDGSGSCFDSPTMATLITSIIELKWIARGGERDIEGRGRRINLNLRECVPRIIFTRLNWSSTLRCPVGSGGQRYSKMYRLERYRYTIYEKKIE